MHAFHAVVHTDHESALVVRFDADPVLVQTVKAHQHDTRQHHSGVRTEHEFFGSVCDALEGVVEVLVTGSHTATNDFRHYVDKHRPLVAHRIVGYDVVDHPTQNQLVAHARTYFEHFNLMSGRPAAPA